MTAPAVSTPGRDDRAKSPYDVANVREIDHHKYLQTNIREYLEKDDHVKDIYDLQKPNNKLI